jgi:hypothetical protein
MDDTSRFAQGASGMFASDFGKEIALAEVPHDESLHRSTGIVRSTSSPPIKCCLHNPTQRQTGKMSAGSSYFNNFFTNNVRDRFKQVRRPILRQGTKPGRKEDFSDGFCLAIRHFAD